jgi:protein subunit release factor A
MSDYPYIKSAEVKIDIWCSEPKDNPMNWLNAQAKGVVLTHIPTGISVKVETERSQYKNRHLAMVELNRMLEERAAVGCDSEEHF